MIKLYQFRSDFGLPNLSPFCMKLECFLRMAKLEYSAETVTTTGQSPKGKCPYIEDDGQKLGDSELIMDYLEQKYTVKLDAELSTEQKAYSRAIQGMLDDRLYWCAVYSRWQDDRNWPKVRELFFGSLPFPINKIVPKIARKSIIRQIYGQGMGRHSEEDIYAIGCADIAAIADILGTKDYIHGNKATRIDACVFSYIANLLLAPFDSPLGDETQKHDNLKAYSERMMNAYFSTDT